ncbi:Stk1 family PASTA domain-containing Ser/Thr kinase [Lactobacillus pantheris]|uniref:Stk1 family PASTA domain-containing Ser/Thr kinase n=1 Tax=Lacticaseibacillus pantheris TaxID=171523 RepID=UPI0006D0E2ED
MIEPGMTLDGRYKLFKTLGEGGMANVYLAHDLILDRDVAVKVLRLDLQSDPDAARRFRREAMATLELSHPNIVSIYDVGEFEGQQYLVMEYVDGKNLKQYIVEHFPIPYAKVVAMMTQVLGAIETAHEHNIIHRDLKPQNIMVDRDGNVKIADFGIAVALSETAVTQTNSLLGSVHYMSPEQARGSLPTKQSDIYSLGVILYEMLTGSVPFEGDSAVTIALKHFQEDIPYVRDFDPRIPQALENVVLKSTAKDPQQRYPSAAAMASDLATSLDASRSNEPRFIPEGSSDSMAATKRIDPAVKAATIAAAASALGKDGQDVKADADKDAKKQPGKKAHPKRKRALIIGGLAIVLILLISGMVAVFGKGDVTVPDVTGDTVAVATTKLKSAHLKVGDTTYKSSGSVTKDHIILTDPTKGDSVKENSAVNLVISKGKSKYTVGKYVGKNYSQVSDDLKRAGFNVVKLTQSSSKPSGTILAQSIDPGKKRLLLRVLGLN